MNISRRAWAVCSAITAAIAWALQFLATHWPPPSAVATEQQEGVRRTWRAAAAIGDALWVFDGPGGPLDLIPGDKLLHIALFAGVGGLAMLCVVLTERGWRTRFTLLVGLVVMALADEWTQRFVGRIGDSMDAISNAVGVVLGTSFVVIGHDLWAARRRNDPTRHHDAEPEKPTHPS